LNFPFKLAKNELELIRIKNGTGNGISIQGLILKIDSITKLSESTMTIV
jgi:hypothetical protein